MDNPNKDDDEFLLAFLIHYNLMADELGEVELTSGYFTALYFIEEKNFLDYNVEQSKSGNDYISFETEKHKDEYKKFLKKVNWYLVNYFSNKDFNLFAKAWGLNKSKKIKSEKSKKSTKKNKSRKSTKKN